MIDLIKNNKATDIICFETKKPIFAEEGAFFLDYRWYHKSVDIDKVINEYTKGEYKSAEELYDDESDYYFYTTYHEQEDIVENIIEQGFYYNEHGIKIEI